MATHQFSIREILAEAEARSRRNPCDPQRVSPASIDAWFPDGLPTSQRDAYLAQVRTLVKQGISQERAEIQAWFDYCQCHPTEFTPYVTFYFD